MEQAPILEIQPKSPELSFDEQVNFAEALIDAQGRKLTLPHDIEEKNNKLYAGSSMTAEYSDEDMAALKEADDAFTNALHELGEKIPNHKAFIEELERAGKKDLAKSVMKAFEIHKENLFQRLFKHAAA